jgi:hypothetical protein
MTIVDLLTIEWLTGLDSNLGSQIHGFLKKIRVRGCLGPSHSRVIPILKVF